MSERNVFLRKSRFRVVYRVTSVGGLSVPYKDDDWKQYDGRSRTYVAACEEAERLRGEPRFNPLYTYSYKVVHEKLLKGKENS